MKYNYILYDEKIISDIEMRELRPYNGEETTNPISIKLGFDAITLPDDFKKVFDGKEMRASIDGEVIWFTNQWGGFYIPNDHEIYVAPHKSEDIPQLPCFILGYCMSFIFRKRGEYAFHCSAVYNPVSDSAVLITGVSGAGKSTFTSKLLDKGYILMSDDVAMLSYDNNGLYTKSAYPQQKMCRDLVERRNLDVSTLVYIDEDKDKFAVKVSDFHAPKARVSCIVCLSKLTKPGEVEAHEVTGLNKIKAISDNLFLAMAFFQEEIGTSPQEMMDHLQMAGKTDILSIARPEGRNTIDEMIAIYDKFSEGK